MQRCSTSNRIRALVLNQRLAPWGAVWVLAGTPLAAQTAAQHVNGDLSVAVATRATPAPPVIDGRLTDAAWAAATPITRFTQRDPEEGAPATERTEARVLYTDDAIYVAVRAYDSRPGEIRGILTRRDQWSPSDWIGVAIDSYRDRRTAFAFLVNAAGVKRDVYFFDDNNEDTSWDANWEVATTVDRQGWAAEFRVPFSQLRFAAAERHEFGFNVYRRINRLNEEQYWRVPPKDQSGVVSRFGDLVGIEGIAPPRRIELLPYAAGSADFHPAETGNPFRSGDAETGRVGADLNVGVTSNLTLSATINPDFGQVEADPAVVNLSTFETFFPEKRPFFNEGSDIFRFPISLGDGDGANEQLFYTRRIGRAPQGGADPRGGFVQEIQNTTILGAAKLSGKTPSGWTVGMLGALTAEERASVVDAAGDRHEDVVEPRGGYVVGRLAKDFRHGLTQLGVFGTALDRTVPDELSWMRSEAYALGANWTHRFGGDAYAVNGWLVGSHVRGSETAIAITQRSSARYFQRPDAAHLRYDPMRTSLSGVAGQFIASKTSGDWRGAAGVDTRSPGFEVNDVGFQRDADRSIQFLWLNRRWLQPGAVFRRVNVNANQWSGWSYGWERLALGGNVNFNFTLLNYWNGYGGVGRELEALAAGQLRGGPAFVEPGRLNAWAGLSSDQRKRVRGGLGMFYGRQDQGGGWALHLGPNVSWRPASNLDFTVAPSLFRQHDAWQYLRAADVLGERHYLFGDLQQTTVSTTLRGNLTFSPTMSLQIYAQPFVASADYRGIKRVSDPRGATLGERFDELDDDRLVRDGEGFALDLNRDGVVDVDLGNPDFTVLSFRSNVVLRWEYSLGSTLFLVWQHGRTGFENDGTFSFPSRFGDLFAHSETRNTFVVKLNYWLSL